MDTKTDAKFRLFGMAVLAVTLAAGGGYGTAQAQQRLVWSAQQGADGSGANSWVPLTQRGWAESDEYGGRPPDRHPGRWGASRDWGGWPVASPNGFASGSADGRVVENDTEHPYGQRTWANLGKPDRPGGGDRKPQASYWRHDPGTGNGYAYERPPAPAPLWGGGYFGVAPPYYVPYGRGGYGDWPFNGGGFSGFNPLGFW